LAHVRSSAVRTANTDSYEAAEELTVTLKGNFEKFEIGFAMGELLCQQENWGQGNTGR